MGEDMHQDPASGEPRGEIWDDLDPDNLLDNRVPEEWQRIHHRAFFERERDLVESEGTFRGGTPEKPLHVLSVGCGPTPRKGIPAGSLHIVGVDSDPAVVAEAQRLGGADAMHEASATALPFEAESFDVVVFRLVLHHVVDQGPLRPALAEAYRVLRPGGRVLAIEPNLFHPIGVALYLANKLGWAKAIKGTCDDWPLSPLAFRRDLRAEGFEARILALEYGWRRLPPVAQRAFRALEAFGDWPVARYAGHTFMAIGVKPSG